MLGVIGVIGGALAVGLATGGIGFGGLFFTALACMLVAALLLRYPRLKVPARAELAVGPLGKIPGKAEMWLESRRDSLPPAAQRTIDTIGIQLDALGLQLDHLDEAQPATDDIRKLVGEHLPGVVSRYTANPARLRRPVNLLGNTPDDALIDGLARISGAIDQVTRQLASGEIDDLAIKARHLDYGLSAAATSA